MFLQAIRPLPAAAGFRCSVPGLHAFPLSLSNLDTSPSSDVPMSTLILGRTRHQHAGANLKESCTSSPPLVPLGHRQTRPCPTGCCFVQEVHN